MNKEDGGNRKFILVECEDYAENITAERVRRVINGVPGASDASLREGLGGSFTYCNLGNPIDVEGMLTGDDLPSESELAAYLLYTATGVAVEPQPQIGYTPFYSTDEANYYLIYIADEDYLCRASLTEALAKEISDDNRVSGKEAIVWAPDSTIGQRTLAEWGITFCQIPYEMLRTG